MYKNTKRSVAAFAHATNNGGNDYTILANTVRIYPLKKAGSDWDDHSVIMSQDINQFTHNLCSPDFLNDILFGNIGLKTDTCAWTPNK